MPAKEKLVVKEFSIRLKDDKEPKKQTAQKKAKAASDTDALQPAKKPAQKAPPKKAPPKKAPPRKAKAKVKKADAEPKYQHPTEVKAHTPKLTPKSELPKDYQHPIAHPKKSVTLPPSEWGAAREKEVADSQPEAIAARAKKAKPAKKAAKTKRRVIHNAKRTS